MKKKMITNENYPKPFIDRRNGMPPLTDDVRSWAPIFVPVIGVLVTVGIYVATVVSTTALANENRKSVETNKSSITNIDKRLAVSEANFFNIADRLKSIERKVDILVSNGKFKKED